jgi:hypothetical protein
MIDLFQDLEYNMSIGLVSDDMLAAELTKLSGPVNRRAPSDQIQSDQPIIVEKPSKGRSEGDNNIPDSLRQIIGEDAVINGRASAVSLAASFGISPSSVSAYAKGATSTTSYNTPSKSIIGHINKSRARAVKKAQTTLNGALSAITQEKLDYTDAKDLSAIAKDMSVIIKNLEPEKVVPLEDQTKGPQFVIFAPQFRQENSFESIVVNE